MNFKEEFDKDCNKITASDELINKTLMNAMLHDDKTICDKEKGTDNVLYNNSTCSHNNTTSNNSVVTNNKSISKHIKRKSSFTILYRIIAVAAATIILCIGAYNLLIPGIHNKSRNKTDSSTLKVYAGENTEELNKGGLSMAYSKDSADHASNIQAWGEQGQHITIMLYFDLNIQLTDSSSSIKHITITSSDENTHLLTREAIPDEIAANDYKISDEYGKQHSLFKANSLPDAGYRTFHLFNSKEQFLYIDHNNEYSADYSDFEHLCISYELIDVSSLNTQLTITAEYEDGTSVLRHYSATAYASELYMFIREIR